MFPFCYSANAELCPSHSTLYLQTKEQGVFHILSKVTVPLGHAK